jgi:hypothetical protein
MLAISGCRKSHKSVLSYSNLCGVNQEQFGKMSGEDVRDWLKNKFGSYTIFEDPNAVKQMQLNNNDDLIIGYMGTSSNKKSGTILAYLRNDRLIRITINDSNNEFDEPEFGEIISSFGPPEWLLISPSYYENIVYGIQLDYPHLGFSVGSVEEKNPEDMYHNGELSVFLSNRIQVESINCYLFGNMVDILQNAFFLMPADATIAMQMRLTWPGLETYVPLK